MPLKLVCLQSSYFIFCLVPLQPLIECYTKLKEVGGTVSLRLTDTWLRHYQVRPGETVAIFPTVTCWVNFLLPSTHKRGKLVMWWEVLCFIYFTAEFEYLPTRSINHLRNKCCSLQWSGGINVSWLIFLHPKPRLCRTERIPCCWWAVAAATSCRGLPSL